MKCPICHRPAHPGRRCNYGAMVARIAELTDRVHGHNAAHEVRIAERPARKRKARAGA